MKPTVINNTSETPSQTHHDPSNVQSQSPNNGHSNNDHSRRFPQFRQHGFGFENPDDDVFADMGLRSRLNRMGNPFDWSARKRRGSGQNTADAYDHYFDDVDFPNFGSTWDAFGRVGNKRSQHPQEANDRSGFFNYVPQEFRQYVPEHFGGYFNGPRHDRHGQPYMQQQPPQPQQPQQHQQPPQQPPPQQQQQPTQQQSSQPSGSKSNLCDAAIQTDDPGTQNNGERRDGANYTENDNRNGVNTNRSSSSASSSSNSTPYGNEVHMSTSTDGPGAYANTSAGNNQNQYYQQNPNYAHQAPPYGRNYQQPYGQQYYQHPPSHQQNQYHGKQAASPPPQQQPQPEGFVRNVPIVLEETGTPVPRAAAAATNVAASPPTASSNKTRPEPLNKDSFAQNQPIPADQPIPCPPPPSHNQQTDQQHSDPSNADSAPPQTPHTADCISKIQAIQRDVLELMLAVEQFGGKRGDKDYAYLDEMLTRNLLKLDTIDTNGKESIRLARKEAIKCIQTSIAVLEAKADLNLNEKRDGVDQANADQAIASNSDASAPAAPVDDKVTEIMDIEEPAVDSTAPKNTTESSATDSTSEIPEMQQNVENISIEDKPSNDNDKQPPAEQLTKTDETGDAKK